MVRRRSLARLTHVLLTLGTTFLVAHPAVAGESGSTEAMQVFEDRIMPIFRSPDPSSCVQCHLASVDIKDYILPSHTETFLALRKADLIDLQNPEASKILKLIQMGEEDADPLARRIHEKTRQAEYDAFAAWIKACCSDPQLSNLSPPQDLASVGPSRPLEVVRHARKSRVVESFVRNVWSQRMRCFPCHTPHEIDSSNPKHEKPAENHRKFVDQYGAKMNLFQKTPEETLRRMIAGSRNPPEDRYPMINLAEPSKSLLVLKPTSKLPPRKDGEFQKPSSSDPVSHMGGLKMHPHDHSYKSIVTWIQDYADTVQGGYVDIDDLPADNWVPTQTILRIRDVPEDWGPPAETVVQMFVHPWNKEEQKWSDKPVAFTQGLIAPRRAVAGALFLIRSNLSEQSASPNNVDESASPLPAGNYQIRVYRDDRQSIAESPETLLGPAHFAGQAAIEAQWNSGYPNAQTFSAKELELSPDPLSSKR